MVVFAVSEEKNRWLKEKMELLGVREEDLEERFIRSSGNGGQRVNKASTCVYLKHKPTGIKIKYMAERSQSLNRFLARRELLRKLELMSDGETEADIKRDKARKQKARREKKSRAKYASNEDKKEA